MLVVLRSLHCCTTHVALLDAHIPWQRVQPRRRTDLTEYLRVIVRRKTSVPVKCSICLHGAGISLKSIEYECNFRVVLNTASQVLVVGSAP